MRSFFFSILSSVDGISLSDNMENFREILSLNNFEFGFYFYDYFLAQFLLMPPINFHFRKANSCIQQMRTSLIFQLVVVLTSSNERWISHVKME